MEVEVEGQVKANLRMALGIRDKGDDASIQSVLSCALQCTNFSTLIGNSLNCSCNTARIARDHKYCALKCAKLAIEVADGEDIIAQIEALVPHQHLGETGIGSTAAGASSHPPASKAGDNVAAQNG